MAKTPPDPLMKRVAKLFDESGKTLEEVGLAMGADPDTARMTAWQFMNRTTDPRLSMLRRFAKAVGVTLDELVSPARK